jgi:hypothetical protein
MTFPDESVKTPKESHLRITSVFEGVLLLGS